MRLIAPLIALIVVISGASVLTASASGLNVSAKKLYAEAEDVAMCDLNVTISSVDLLGVLLSVTVSNISVDCFGWTLKVRVTDSTGSPLGSELTRVVDATSESWINLNINFTGSYQTFFVFEAP